MQRCLFRCLRWSPFKMLSRFKNQAGLDWPCWPIWMHHGPTYPFLDLGVPSPRSQAPYQACWGACQRAEFDIHIYTPAAQSAPVKSHPHNKGRIVLKSHRKDVTRNRRLTHEALQNMKSVMCLTYNIRYRTTVSGLLTLGFQRVQAEQILDDLHAHAIKVHHTMITLRNWRGKRTCRKPKTDRRSDNCMQPS